MNVDVNSINHPPLFETRLFAFFSISDVIPKFQRITIENKSGKQEIWVMEKADQSTETTTVLQMLHPQARKFLTSCPDDDDCIKCYHLAQPLLDELKKAVWNVDLPKWASTQISTLVPNKELCFKITDVNAIGFPGGIFTIYLDIKLDIPKTSDNEKKKLSIDPNPALTDDKLYLEFGKILLNTLKPTGTHFINGSNNGAKINRRFGDPRILESAKKRFGTSGHLALIQGLCGESVFLPTLVSSLLPANCTFLMGDRFLSSVLLKTTWDGQGNVFTTDDYVDFVRLARGEHNGYLPTRDNCLPGQNGILCTFENVAFAHASEGSCCWIRPKADQKYLQDQFKNRFDTIYLYLFLLALHQRYALIDLARRLDLSTPSAVAFQKLMKSGKLTGIEKQVAIFRPIRIQIANFYLRHYFREPASMTNHREYYRVLQDVLGISSLLEEVRQACEELDRLVSDLHAKRLDSVEKRKRENELFLTLVAEIVAIPYYSFNFLHHDLGWNSDASLIAALSLTGLTMIYSFYPFVHEKFITHRS